MDFIKDLEIIAEDMLVHYGVDYSTTASGEDIIRMYLNVWFKLIEQQPRQVIKSSKLQNRIFDYDTQKGLIEIENKFLQGDNLNQHLSKMVLNDGEYPDYLFFDWGIYHLHLGVQPDTDDYRFVERTGNVLFLIITNDKAYFIDVRLHGKSEPAAFVRKDLLQIVADEWSWLLDRYRLPDVNDIENEINHPEQIKKMRKSGINTIHMINNKAYVPPGGGLTTNEASIKVAREYNRLYYMAKNAMKYVTDNRAEVDQILLQYQEYNPEKANFHLCLGREGFYIVEQQTKALIYLKDIGLI
jgi:hypothetical protein